jgi:hypothetical protein
MSINKPPVEKTESEEPYVNFDDYDPDRDLSTNPRSHLFSYDFYKHPKAVENACEILFHIKRRGTTIKRELYFGLVQFISCLYVLPVVPHQLYPAGYNTQPTIIATAALSGVGCVVSGLFANLPFIIAPPTSVSIFFSVFLQV